MDEKDINWYLARAPLFGSMLQHLVVSLQELRPGDVVTREDICQEFLSSCSASHLLQGCDYPFTSEHSPVGGNFNQPLCISVNECVAHGRNRDVSHGDIVTVDAGISLTGPTGRSIYFDAAATVRAGSKKMDEPLLEAPFKALQKAGQLTGELNTAELSAVIQQIAQEYELDIVAGLTGHGIGYSLHDGIRITNVVDPSSAKYLIPGFLFCLEPMYVDIGGGSGRVADIFIDSDGWSVMARGLSSHWETTFLYRDNRLMDVVGITAWSLGEENASN
jgi:Xaa-Pro aminopeptidase